MKQFFKQFIRTRCEVVIDEDRLADTIKILDSHKINSNLAIGNCGWMEVEKWYVRFTASNRTLGIIKSELKKANFREILILTNTSSWVKVEKLG